MMPSTGILFLPEISSAYIRRMRKPPKQPKKKFEPTQSQREDAARLMALYLAAKKARGVTQTTIAEKLGFDGQSAVSQYLHAKIGLNLRTALKFAKFFGVELEAISPTIASELISPLQLPSTEDTHQDDVRIVEINTLFSRLSEGRKQFALALLKTIDSFTLVDSPQVPAEEKQVIIGAEFEVNRGAVDGKRTQPEKQSKQQRGRMRS